MELRPGTLLDGGRLRLDAPLGRGGFGTVWQAVELFGYGVRREAVVLRRVAVKCLPPLSRKAESRRIIQETQALVELVHESILRFYYAFADATGTYLVTELATEGDLRRFYGGSIPTEAELRDLFFSIVHGLAYLHERGFVHGDLKPENVLVTEGEKDSVRYLLADFGLRALIGERRFQGTVPYIAPEVYSETPQPLTDKADIYALGVLLLETATGRSLRSLLSEGTLEALSQPRVRRNTLEKVQTILLSALDAADWKGLGLPSFLGVLLRQCFADDPSERPSARDLLSLWLALERGRTGTLQTYRLAKGAEPRYQMLYGRLLRVEETWDAARRETVVVASVVGAGEGVVHVHVGQKTNLAMYTTLQNLRETLAERVPMVSFFNVRARNLLAMEFEADFRSYVVVQPFELVEVTLLSGSHHCTRAYLHRVVFDRGMPNEGLLRGTLLHRLFAEFCAEPSQTCETLWKRRWLESCLDLTFFLPDDDAYFAFRKSIESAFGRLRRILVREGVLEAHRELEASRWSYELGLVGRVDALFRFAGGLLRAYELKSGRFRRGDIVQVQAYLAMLREEESPSVEARLLSADKVLPLEEIDDYGLLASIRNQILNLRDILLRPRIPGIPILKEYPYFGYQSSKCRRCANLEPYLHEECRASTALFGERCDAFAEALSPLERDYFWHWTRLILREQTERHRIHLAPLLEVTLTDAELEVFDVHVLPEHRIEEALLVQCEGRRLRFEFSPTFVEFPVGGDVLIHRGDARKVADVLRATVVESTETSLLVESYHPSRAERFAREVGTFWYIDNLPDLRGMNALQRALNLFIRSKNIAMKALVLEGRIPRWQGRFFPGVPGELRRLADGRRLNDQQTRALLSAFDETGFLSITGPPGTGKTATIHAIVEAFVRQKCRVLVAGLTHNAVDNVLERLIGSSPETTFSFFRFGIHPTSYERLAPLLEAAGRDPRFFFAQRVGEVFESVGPLRAYLETVPVFAGTAHSLLRSPWIAEEAEVPAFDLVIVDEATQLQEPLTAALLTLGKKAILVGDEKQLGPVVAMPFDPERDECPSSLFALGIRGLEQSLFVRLNRLLKERGEHESLIFLSRQYRMHPAIGDWASRRFYGGQLETLTEKLPEIDLLEGALRKTGWNLLRRICSSEYPFVFLDVEGEETTSTASRVEARLAVLLVKAFSELGVTSIGCITPYRSQLALLQREFSAAGMVCECGTVDAFQGREKSVIILSTARRDRLTEFLTHPNRLNVSITRARVKCILLGSGALLRGHSLLWSLIEQETCFREHVDVESIEHELASG